MKIDTKIVLKTLKGEPLIDDAGTKEIVNLGNALGNIFSNNRNVVERFTAYKAYKFATDFFEKDIVELNDADFGDILEYLDKLNDYPAILTGQIVGILRDIKEQERVSKEKKDEIK